jgi:hypothetical protein
VLLDSDECRKERIDAATPYVVRTDLADRTVVLHDLA